MSITTIRPPKPPKVEPKPKCAKTLRLVGLTVHCDAPEGHVPDYEHVGVIRWQDDDRR